MLFAISLILALTTSYLIISIVRPRNFLTAFLFLFLSTFAQIILITELLSLCNCLQPYQFLGLQVIILIPIIVTWEKLGRPLFSKTPTRTFKRIFKSIKTDKALIALSLGWIFLLFISLFLALTINITRSGDAEIYHVARSYFWVINQSINHFETSQVRMLAFPINSEILYSWIILFFNKAICLGLIGFVSYLVSITALFGLMNNYALQRRLWVIFIVSAFANIIVQMSSTESDIIVAALVLSSMYLFKEGIKTQSNTNIYFSALSYAIAIGTKTTAFFLIPAVAIYFIYQSRKILKQNVLNPFFIFLGFSVLNFTFFAAYNYIANFVSFGNFLGAPNTIELHKNFQGIQGAASSFIKTLFLMFDFTGVPKGDILITLKNFIENGILTGLSLEHIQNGINSTNTNDLSRTMFDTLIGTGFLGGILFIPCLFISLLRGIFAPSKNAKENLTYASMFILTILIMSVSIVFMTFNNRFLSAFILVCAPILGYTYFYKRANWAKWLITLIAIFYFTVVSTHIWSRPFVKITDALFVKHQTLEEINNRVTWLLYDKNTDFETSEQRILNVISQAPSHFKIIFFQPYNSTKCRTAEAILNGKNIEIKNLELFKQENLLNYDIIIYPIGGQISNVSLQEELARNCIYEDKNLNTITDPTTPRCDCKCYIEDEYFKLLFNNGYRSVLPPSTKNNETKYLILAKVAQK